MEIKANAVITKECYNSRITPKGVESFYRNSLDFISWNINGKEYSYTDVWNSDYRELLQYINAPQTAVENYSQDGGKGEELFRNIEKIKIDPEKYEGRKIEIELVFDLDDSHFEKMEKIFKATIRQVY